MAVTPEDIKLIAPEFCELKGADIQAFIDDATLLISIDCFGNTADMAIKYLTAHMLTMSKRGSIGGEITSKAVGSLSIGYSSGSTDGGVYGSSSYGKMYQQLRNSRVMTMRVLC